MKREQPSDLPSLFQADFPWYPAHFAGSCYPLAPQDILPYFRGFFDHEKSAAWPEKLPSAASTSSDVSSLLGIITPHIDFRISPQAYTWAFSPILSAPFAKKYLILGVGHQAQQQWGGSHRGLETPLGSVRVDSEANDTLREAFPSEFFGDSQAFDQEHSIEFTVILLQALHHLCGLQPNFTIVPILCGGLSSLMLQGLPLEREPMLAPLANYLRAWFDAQEGQAQLILSIDGCHQGPRFQHPYVMDSTQCKATAQWEARLWQWVEDQNLEGFWNFLQQDGNSRYFDGVGALALLMKMFPEGFCCEPSYYEQWVSPLDFSLVSYSSAKLFKIKK